MPKISVIVPVYNVELYLDECIKSIIKQTYRNLEIILVDDGSTDKSGEICDQYAISDKRILVIHKANGGLSDARNTGIDAATGEYITFIDSDDYYSDLKTLEYCINKLKHDNAIGFVEFPVNHPEREYKKTDTILTNNEDIYRAWIKHRIITNYVWDKLFRRDLIKNIRFPKGRIFEDRYVFPEIINACHKICTISMGGIFYRQHPQQITRQKCHANFLTDQINADINILKNMPKSQSDLYCTVYYRALYNTTLTQTNPNIELAKFTPSITACTKCAIPIGIKIRLIILKFLGHKTYFKIFGKY